MKQRFFQWTAGERRGEVVIFDQIEADDDFTFIKFKDGSRINTELVAEINVNDLTGKMMAEVESPNNIWKFEEAKGIEDNPRTVQDWESQVKYEVPSADEIAHADLNGQSGVTRNVKKKKVINLIPPRATKNKFGQIANTDDIASSFGDYNKNKNQSEQSVSNTQPATPEVPNNQLNKDDPVYIMMNKALKKDTEIDMSLTISLPNTSLFNVVAESFDEGSEKALEYIIENIDITSIKESLKVGIKQMYNGGFLNDEVIKYHQTNENKPGVEAPYASYTPEVVEEPVVGDGVPEGEFIPIENNDTK